MKGQKTDQLPKQMNDLAARGDLKALKKLIADGASPALRDRETGYTPLLSAAARGRGEVVKYLLTLGVDVDQKVKCEYPDDDDDATALMLACENGHGAMVEMPLKAGADVKDALESAARRGDMRIVRRLLKSGAKVNGHALRFAGERADVEMMALLLKRAPGLRIDPGLFIWVMPRGERIRAGSRRF